MMNRFKLVIVDIDGTLNVKGESISKINHDALEKLHEKGILIGIGTGRDALQIKGIEKKWNLDFSLDFIVGMNGAQLYDYSDDTLTENNYIKYSDVLKIYEHFKPLDLSTTFFMSNNIQLCTRIDGEILESLKRNKGEYSFYEIKSIDELKGQNVAKIMFRVDVDKMTELEAFYKLNPIKGFNGFRTTPFCFEVMDCNVAKNNGLELYCQKHNIDLDECYAFGDTTNDIGMLKVCHGVCLIDGTDDAKSVSEFITDYPCCESGFGRFVEEHLLKEEG